ncbi:acyl carrier protein [Lentzea sp. NPDC042327]|uniref:acyl carrier protein n=1 Tax=Lentzea sp. NPDC042327 TaxID=3154801 RepID=UPI0033D8A682
MTGPVHGNESSALAVVVQELARVLEIPADQLSPDDRLAYLPNVDSLRLLDAITAVENTSRVKLSEDDLVTARTVAQLAALVESAEAAAVEGDRS